VDVHLVAPAAKGRYDAWELAAGTGQQPRSTRWQRPGWAPARVARLDKSRKFYRLRCAELVGVAPPGAVPRVDLCRRGPAPAWGPGSVPLHAGSAGLTPTGRGHRRAAWPPGRPRAAPRTVMDPVHDAGRMSWQMNLDLSEQLTIGLFVRDDDALHSGLTWLPPPCPVALSRNPRRPACSGTLGGGKPWHETRAWNGPDRPVLAVSWWAPPSFDALAEAPALQAVVARHFADAASWAQTRKPEHVDTVLSPKRPPVETTLVADLERTSGRRARAFSLRLTQIPVEGQHLWQLHPDHVLISAALLRDTAEYRRRLTPVVQALL